MGHVRTDISYRLVFPPEDPLPLSTGPPDLTPDPGTPDTKTVRLKGDKASRMRLRYARVEADAAYRIDSVVAAHVAALSEDYSVPKPSPSKRRHSRKRARAYEGLRQRDSKRSERMK